MMDPEVKALWLEALRSGDYQQGTNRLRKDNDHYCYLGVLCDLHQKQTGLGEWTEWGRGKWVYREIGAPLVGPDASEYSLPLPVMNWAGLTSIEPEVEYLSMCVPITLVNDRSAGTPIGQSFEVIADIIEAQL